MHLDRSRQQRCHKEAIFIIRKGSTSKVSFTMISNNDSFDRSFDLSLDFFDSYTTKSFYKSINWKGEYHDSIGFDIISFDLGDEEFQRIRLPDDVVFDFNFLMWDGNLGIGVTKRNHMNIFVKKEYSVTGSWIKVPNFEVEKHGSLNNEMVSYNPGKHEIKKFKIHRRPIFDGFDAFIYLESLVSVKVTIDQRIAKRKNRIHDINLTTSYALS
ncbi:F-box protein CPR30-like isoform X1 [Gossypium australe]|uniref:F-box protein CPR30-like isoform X1 n=1 Tax=Gossypium australe TaxID=47621 RepID=A0A5B6V7J3_9ROSI|nr:F-box protein CPR30-like isoform X1 [Gossypium australe]